MKPLAQLQLPPVQLKPGSQLASQALQWLGSVLVSVQLPPQTSRPASHAHVPDSQVWPVTHVSVHATQSVP